MKLNSCRFWHGPVAFQHLAHFTTSNPPTSILWCATFDIPTFCCGVTRVLNCESHNLTSLFLTRGTCVLRGIVNQITQHRVYLQCSFVSISPSSWPGHAQKFAMAVTRGIWQGSCEAHFPIRQGSCGACFFRKRQGVRKGLAASHCHSQSH